MIGTHADVNIRNPVHHCQYPWNDDGRNYTKGFSDEKHDDVELDECLFGSSIKGRGDCF
jgi:hypothetical protein